MAARPLLSPKPLASFAARRSKEDGTGWVMAQALTTGSLADERYVTAVEAIYGAAAAPETWPGALTAIAAVFDDVGANLTYFRDDGRVGAIVSPSLAPGVAEYNDKWWRQDIRSARAVERSLFLGEDVVTDRHVVSDEEIDGHPFYTDFLAKFGLRWFAGVSISPDPHINVGLTVQRSAAKQPFSDSERATLGRLARHAEQSLRLGLRLIDSELARVGLQEALARLGLGIFLLDTLGRIVFSNSTADRLLGTGLERVGDRLTTSVASDRAALDQATSIITRGEVGDALFNMRPLLIRRPDSDRPLVVYLLPVRTMLDPSIDQFLARVRGIILVVDAAARAPADPALVRDLLGITLGEARVAALIGAGLPTRDVSARLGVTEETVRTVLKRVFDKANVSRQSELAALLNRIALGTAGP
jgi:DNA-binding CsgD family transcriptional regulator/PAS domain-containing protein